LTGVSDLAREVGHDRLAHAGNHPLYLGRDSGQQISQLIVLAADRPIVTERRTAVPRHRGRMRPKFLAGIAAADGYAWKSMCRDGRRQQKRHRSAPNITTHTTASAFVSAAALHIRAGLFNRRRPGRCPRRQAFSLAAGRRFADGSSGAIRLRW
jgi:hypothetical protein